jgi:hypothetical protein
MGAVRGEDPLLEFTMCPLLVPTVESSPAEWFLLLDFRGELVLPEVWFLPIDAREEDPLLEFMTCPLLVPTVESSPRYARVEDPLLEFMMCSLLVPTVESSPRFMA